MQVDGDATHGEICVAQFEEALLEDYAERLFRAADCLAAPSLRLAGRAFFVSICSSSF